VADVRFTLDVLRTGRGDTAEIERRRRLRLASIIRHARERSPFYRNHYRGLPSGEPSLADLPPVSKPELMADFDAWVTDPAVTRAGVEAFVADPARIGESFLGRYFVCSTSGTTGHPGLFVHDQTSVAVFRALTARADLSWLAARDWMALAGRGFRWAGVVGTGSHFGGAGWVEFQRNRNSALQRAYRVFSAQDPLDDLVEALAGFDPAILTGYPSSMALIAEAQAEGKCRLRPVLVAAAGESITAPETDRLSAAFGVPCHEIYGASEFLQLAFDCPEAWLHVNADWVILEPVDDRYRPTPIGEPSHTVLVTNLANRVQPIIRYDLGDSVIARPGPCPCASSLPAIRVTGRRDDVLAFIAGDGEAVRLPPLAIGSVVEGTASVHRSQLVQIDRSTIRVRLEARPGEDPERMWAGVLADLDRYLVAQGVTGVSLIRAEEPPRTDEKSGKFRQVIGAGLDRIEAVSAR
jgi:phenylacetate-CoA ligase